MFNDSEITENSFEKNFSAITMAAHYSIGNSSGHSSTAGGSNLVGRFIRLGTGSNYFNRKYV